jgi:hypothetical protein
VVNLGFLGTVSKLELMSVVISTRVAVAVGEELNWTIKKWNFSAVACL